MSRKDELIALAERVEALTGPDRGVDARICIALGLSKDNVMVGVDGWCINSGINPNPYRSPTYTASLDAAMSLVPEGYDCVHGWDYPNRAIRVLFMDDDGDRLFRGRAATPALALTAAALRAIAQIEGDTK
jgi:hypothetical protein